MESILNKYHEKKKQEEQSSDKFEKLLEDMLNKLDIMTFERTISKIVHDGYLISVNGITYKLPLKSINIVNELFKMFSEDNIRNPVKSFTDNVYICSFLEDVRPYLKDVRPYPKECHNLQKQYKECTKQCNECMKQTCKEIINQQEEDDCTPEEKALLEKCLESWKQIATDSCIDSDSNLKPKIIFRELF